MQQIAVGGMQLNGIQPQRVGAHGGVGKGVFDVCNVLQRGAGRQWVGGQKTLCAGAEGRPGIRVRGRHGATAFPRAQAAGFATGVRQLNAHRHGAVAADVRQHRAQGLYLRIIPQPQVIPADAATCFYGGGF